MKQKISEEITEECLTECSRCHKFYSGGSSLTYDPTKLPRKILTNYCKKCFDKIVDNK